MLPANNLRIIKVEQNFISQSLLLPSLLSIKLMITPSRAGNSGAKFSGTQSLQGNSTSTQMFSLSPSLIKRRRVDVLVTMGEVVTRTRQIN